MHESNGTPRLGALRRIHGPSDRFALAQVIARHGGRGDVLVDVDEEPVAERRYSLTTAGREALRRSSSEVGEALLHEVYRSDPERFWDLVDHIDEVRALHGLQPVGVVDATGLPIVGGEGR